MNKSKLKAKLRETEKVRDEWCAGIHQTKR